TGQWLREKLGQGRIGKRGKDRLALGSAPVVVSDTAAAFFGRKWFLNVSPLRNRDARSGKRRRGEVVSPIFCNTSVDDKSPRRTGCSEFSESLTPIFCRQFVYNCHQTDCDGAAKGGDLAIERIAGPAAVADLEPTFRVAFVNWL